MTENAAPEPVETDQDPRTMVTSDRRPPNGKGRWGILPSGVIWRAAEDEAKE